MPPSFSKRSSFALAALACAAITTSACRPRNADSNASDPPDGGGALGNLYATDPALSHWTLGDFDAIVLGYTDESGLFDADTTSNKLVPNGKKSASGVSFSLDQGKTWQRGPSITPAAPDCAFPPCAIAFTGAPSLSAVEASNRLVYASLGYTRTDVAEPDAIVIATTTPDLRTWDPPRVAVLQPGRPPRSFSLGRRVNKSVIAFTDRVKGELYLASAGYEPPDFTKPELVPISPDADQLRYKDAPILQLASNVEGWVAYVIPHDTRGTTFDLRILHIFRTQDLSGALTPWLASTIFRLDGVEIDPSVPGALGRAWRDERPVSFAVGNVSNHMYLAYRQRSTTTGRSEVFLVDCDSTAESDCVVDENGSNSAGWRVQRFATSYDGGQFQPTVGVDRASDSMALTWLQQTRDGSAEMRVMGIYTIDAAIHFTAPKELSGAWSPCPTAGIVGGAGGTTHYFATRAATVILPFYPQVQTAPSIVTAHADSSYGCQERGELSFDLHVGVETW